MINYKTQTKKRIREIGNKCGYCKSTRLRLIKTKSDESGYIVWEAYACVMCGRITFKDD